MLSLGAVNILNNFVRKKNARKFEALTDKNA